MHSFCIITRFWCGRQELKTYDDMKKALIFKAFFQLNAKMDAKIFLNYMNSLIFIIVFNAIFYALTNR